MQTDFQKELEILSKKIDSEFNKNHKPVPKTIYHYTDAKGLMGILKDKGIHLTQSNYLNDSSELKHGWDITEKIMRKHIEKNKQANNRLSLTLKILLEQGNPLEEYCDVFIASFCKKGDLLNQWRGYGSTDGTFSIGINISKLELQQWDGLYNIVYDEDKQRQHLDYLLSSLIALIEKYNTLLPKKDTLKIIAYFNYNISKALIFFKNEIFKIEQESRLYQFFFHDVSEKYKKLDFRESSSSILPYLKVPLYDTSDKDSDNSRIPIDSITYALSKDSALTEKSIELLLKKHGYDLKDIEIKESKVPLRFK